MVIFYHKNIIKKIVVTHYGEMGQNTTEYYYGLKKELFFGSTTFCVGFKLKIAISKLLNNFLKKEIYNILGCLIDFLPT